MLVEVAALQAGRPVALDDAQAQAVREQSGGPPEPGRDTGPDVRVRAVRVGEPGVEREFGTRPQVDERFPGVRDRDARDAFVRHQRDLRQAPSASLTPTVPARA
ncbi:hypothetical protein [Actinomadura sp. CNU-125]|uniref:hypothetical protein n=1 Tax=Actinomadura sp. CNU-125 TaxID=1904961 RepID=UPI0021CC7C86|nr:hypothetical protein [Actinomadura sp. CNU-125]